MIMKKIFLLLVGLLSLAPTFAQSDGEEDFIPTKKEKNNACKNEQIANN